MDSIYIANEDYEKIGYVINDLYSKNKITINQLITSELPVRAKQLKCLCG